MKIAAGGIMLVFTVVIAGSRAQSVPLQGPRPATTAPQIAEEQFKNIQALKGIPADQLMPSMQFISASLGVECAYRHVEQVFEKDDKKPKVSARKMIGRCTLARPGNRFTIQVEQLQQNVPVDDARFAPPPTPPSVATPKPSAP